MPSSKDKRTKEEILKLLDRAMEQEEKLAEKIKSLETDLADCRKKAENPRAELTEEALSGSKIPFRIDYYRTEKNGPLKGIIEHIPSREPKPFENEGWEAIRNFIGRFLSEESAKIGKKKTSVTKEIKPETDAVSQPLAAEKPVLPPEEQEISPLLQRLKAKFSAEMQGGILEAMGSDAKPQSNTPFQEQRSARMQQLLAKTGARQPHNLIAQPIKTETSTQTPPSRSKLLERLLQEQRRSFKKE